MIDCLFPGRPAGVDPEERPSTAPESVERRSHPASLHQPQQRENPRLYDISSGGRLPE